MNKNNLGGIKTIVLIIVGIILAVGFGVGMGYFLEKNQNQTSENLIVLDETGPIRIGYIASLLTSDKEDVREIGEIEKNSIEMALEEINQSGELKRKLELVYENAGYYSSNKDVNAAILKLMNVDKVPIILGGSENTNSIDVAILTQPKANKVVILSVFSPEGGRYGYSDGSLEVKKYKERFQKDPINELLFLMQGYNSMRVIGDAIKNCKDNDYSCVKEYIYKEMSRSATM